MLFTCAQTATATLWGNTTLILFLRGESNDHAVFMSLIRHDTSLRTCQIRYREVMKGKKYHLSLILVLWVPRTEWSSNEMIPRNTCEWELLLYINQSARAMSPTSEKMWLFCSTRRTFLTWAILFAENCEWSYLRKMKLSLWTVKIKMNE